MTQEDKPIAIILSNWSPNEPRFIVEDAHDGLADDRAFKNGKCVYNQRLGIVYTVEYVVDALNELETHKHPLWSTREAEKKVNKLADSLADEVKKNGLLNEEINQLRIENMRLKKRW